MKVNIDVTKTINEYEKKIPELKRSLSKLPRGRICSTKEEIDMFTVCAVKMMTVAGPKNIWASNRREQSADIVRLLISKG